jgi:hypothetical protein
VSKETEREAITAHFLSIAEPDLGLNIAWPNKAFTTPSGQIFVEFNLVDRGVTRHGLGRSFFKRHNGTMQIDIYTPQDQGTKRSRQLADYWALLYEMLELPTSDGEMIKFLNTTSHPLPTNVIRAENLDDNWDRYVFEAPYYRDQLVEK